MNSVHVPNWGSTRMARFFYACKQSCDIMISFVDTLIADGIRKAESPFLLRPNGLYLIHLFADIHPIFANKYFPKVDSDENLICEVHKIDKNISEVFAGDLHTPKADEVLDSMC